MKPDLNDLGIIGQKVPLINLDKCRGCKVCQVVNACPHPGAGGTKRQGGHRRQCLHHCKPLRGQVPFGALEGSASGYRVYIGGRWGKKVAQGRYLEKVFTDKDEGAQRDREGHPAVPGAGPDRRALADTVERIGFENVQEQLLSDELLQRKEDNLKLDVKGGGLPAERRSGAELHQPNAR